MRLQSEIKFLCNNFDKVLHQIFQTILGQIEQEGYDFAGECESCPAGRLMNRSEREIMYCFFVHSPQCTAEVEIFCFCISHKVSSVWFQEFVKLEDCFHLETCKRNVHE